MEAEGGCTVVELFRRLDEEQRQAIERIERLKKTKLRHFGLGKILAVYGSWAVTDYGVECVKDHIYDIQKERLSEMNWVRHMLGKNWVDMRDFCSAYYKGRELHCGIPQYLSKG